MRVLGTCPDPQHAARQLKELALANQSKDNVTCLVIHVVGAGQDADPSSGLRPASLSGLPILYLPPGIGTMS